MLSIGIKTIKVITSHIKTPALAENNIYSRTILQAIELDMFAYVIMKTMCPIILRPLLILLKAPAMCNRTSSDQVHGIHE